MAAARFKHRDGTVPNLLVLAYTFGGWAAGVWLLAASSLPAAAVGVALVAHTLMVSTYLMHECIHHTIFRHREHNARLGVALAWLNGGCLAGYETLRKKHLHHHADRMDPVGWDFRAFLRDRSRPVRGAVLALEWLYVPAVELLLRGEQLTRPLRGRVPARDGVRVAATLAVRLALLAGLAALSGRAAALYLVAWLLFLTGLRLFDAFHHTFALVVLDDYDATFVVPPEWDRRFEQANTYSNVLAPRHPALELLLLNFGFHNAHHLKPGVPWHRLPALDRRTASDEPGQTQSIWRLLRDYHRWRVRRVLVSIAPEAPAVNIGAVGVSLLTL